MIRVRRSDERGHFDHGWLDTYHTFAFGDYYDPAHTGFRALRVINEDVFAPGTGFGMHGHRDMEILTYVLRGALRHRDSLGHASVLGPGEVQRMTAGTGLRHSEENPSPAEPVHLLQIWLHPERPGLTPGYEQRPFDREAARRGWLALAAPEGVGGTVTIRQDATLWLRDLGGGEGDEAEARYDLAPGRHAWVQVTRGEVALNGQALRAGDGAAVSGEPALTLRAGGPGGAEVLLFDLA